MGRILAVDYGKKRCGIAVSDELQIIATALTTLSPEEALVFIKEYCETEAVDKLVLGYPLDDRGRESDSAEGVTIFKKRLQKKIEGLEIIYEDERYTSVMAQRTLLDSGIGKKKRRDKKLVDKVSATIILQSYMQKNSK